MTEFKKVSYLRQGESLNYDYELELPVPLADWDVFDYWERERVISMRDNLNEEDILFDVGAESGWMSAVFVKFCNIFLIEPMKEFWPNIYETWKANTEKEPVGCYLGLMGNETDDGLEDFSWPKESKGELVDKNRYEYLNRHSADTRKMKLDDLVERSGIIPTAITIDVEGAELIVLHGAEKTLVKNNLKVWVSIHPDLMKKSFRHTKDDVHNFMDKLGYVREYLATDHEEHWFYRKKIT